MHEHEPGAEPASRLRATVLTVSDRVSDGRGADESGPVACEALASFGVEVSATAVVPDEIDEIRRAVRAGLTAGHDVVLLTGGTGLGPRDLTPEAVRPMLDREVPGVAEAIRAGSRTVVPTADLSRIVVGTAGESLVVALPGSPGGVRDGIAVVGPLLRHAVMLARGHNPHAGPGPQHSQQISSAATRTVPTEPGTVAMLELSESVLDAAAHEAACATDAAGAVVSFSGTVRDHDDGRRVTRLDYEAHPDAEGTLREVATEVASRSGVIAVALSHRVGSLEVGDIAIVAAASAAHRGEAFDACRALVDLTKQRLPVWKHQIFVDGTDEWVNAP